MKHYYVLRPVRSPLTYDVGLGFRRLRQDRKYSQQTVANALDISRNSYIAWEANKVDITLTACLAFCDVFSITLTEFLDTYACQHHRPVSKGSALYLE